MNEVKPEDRCSIPDEVFRSLIDRTMEILRRHGLIPTVDPMVKEAEKRALLGLDDEQKDTE